MDKELERIKRRRLMELQRRMLQEEKPVEEEPEKPAEPTPREILDGMFSGRAWEVYETAKLQYPKVMPQVEQALVDGIKSGKIQDRIDGESLFVFLRQVGLNVRLNTSIRYKDHGELKTIGQHIKER